MEITSLGLLGTLNSVDVTPLVVYHATNRNMPTHEAEADVLELKKWLILCVLYPEKDFPMLKGRLDDVWHSALLYTPVYVQLCRALGQDYIHHTPCLDSPRRQLTSNEVTVQERYEELLRLYELEFETKALVTVWPRYIRSPAENCGTVAEPKPSPIKACGLRG